MWAKDGPVEVSVDVSLATKGCANKQTSSIKVLMRNLLTRGLSLNEKTRHLQPQAQRTSSASWPGGKQARGVE